MIYNTKVIINGVEIESGGAEGTPSLSAVKLINSACLGTMEIGAAAADCLTFTINNPFKPSFDGDKVELYVSEVPDDNETLKEQIEDEVGSDETDEGMDADELEYEDETEDEGEDMTETEIEDAEETSAEIEGLQTVVFDGEDLTGGEQTTDEGEEPEWSLVGIYYVYGQDNGENSVTLTCYDTLILLNGTFAAAGTASTWAGYWTALTSELDALGITLDEYAFTRGTDTMTIKGGTTHREALGLLCGYAGGYATCDADGSIGISFYAYADKIIIQEELINYVDTSSGEMLVGNIVCDNGEGITVTSNGGGQSIGFTNYLVTSGLLNAIHEPLYKGIRFTGATVTAQWDSEIVAGELVRIMTEDEYRNYLELKNSAENTQASENELGRVVLVSTQEITFGGAATAVITSICSTETAKETYSISPTIKKIIEAGKTATNYITEDDTGALVIKRDTDDYNVRIDADSVDVRTGEEVLASFGETTVIGSSSVGKITLKDGEITLGHVEALDWLTEYNAFKVGKSGDRVAETSTVYEYKDLMGFRINVSDYVVSIYSIYNNTTKHTIDKSTVSFGNTGSGKVIFFHDFDTVDIGDSITITYYPAIVEVGCNFKVGGKIRSPLETLSPTYTRTSGTAKANTSFEAYRCGQVVHVSASFALYTTSAGGDMAKGTLSGLPKPITEVKASAYNGSKSAIMSLTNSLGVTVRCQDAVSTSSSSYFNFGFTYLTEE